MLFRSGPRLHLFPNVGVAKDGLIGHVGHHAGVGIDVAVHHRFAGVNAQQVLDPPQRDVRRRQLCSGVIGEGQQHKHGRPSGRGRA